MSEFYDFATKFFGVDAKTDVPLPRSEIVLKKGTVIYVDGAPVELTKDVSVSMSHASRSLLIQKGRSR